MYRIFDKIFLEHPREVGLTYFQHMCRALYISSTMIYSGSCLIIHSIFPCLFETTGTDTVKHLDDYMHR